MILLMDNEYEVVNEIINDLQILFNSEFSPDGKFDFRKIEEISEKRSIYIAVDNNIMRYIIEILKGNKNYNSVKQTIASLMFWSKVMKTQLTCGLALFEIGMQNANTNRSLFLQACNDVHPMEWKEMIKDSNYEFSIKAEETILSDAWDFEYSNSPLYISNYIALLKFVTIHLTSKKSIFEQYNDFISWYYNNLLISNPLLVYVMLALIGEVKYPKKANSGNYELILKGCKNQAWDLLYIQLINQLNDNCAEKSVYFLATNDIDIKKIFMNTYPEPFHMDSIKYICNNEDDIKNLEKTFEIASNSIRLYKQAPDKDVYLDNLLKNILKELKGVIEGEAND